MRGGASPARAACGLAGTGIEAGALQSAIVHPQFATNRRVYLYYVKNRADKMTTLALARARLEGCVLSTCRRSSSPMRGGTGRSPVARRSGPTA